MNRKLFNGLLLLTVATGGVGTFTSCKDTEQDFQNVVLVGQKDLSDQIAAIRNLTDGTFKTNLDNEIQRLIDAGEFATAADLIALKNRVDAAETLLGQLEGKYNQLEADYKAADAALKSELEDKIANVQASMQTAIDDLQQSLDALKILVNNEISDLKSRLDTVEGDVSTLQSQLGTLQSTVGTIQDALDTINTTLDDLGTRLSSAENRLTDVELTANDAYTQAMLNKTAIEDIQDNITDLQDKYEALKDLPTELSDLKDRVDDLETKYSDLFDDLSSLTTDFNDLADDFGNFMANFSVWQESVTEKLGEIDALNEEVAKLMNFAEAFKRLVTGLIVERTYNPVFGHLSLPVGIESNMLVNYYAQPIEEVSFPNGLGLNQPGEAFEDEDVRTLPYNGDLLTLGSGEQRLETLGNLYMTINPINRNFDGLSFELVKSNGDVLPAKFEAKASNEVLTFGYTRAETSANGFYKAPIVPTTKDEAGYRSLIQATKVELEPGLKGALRDVIKEHKLSDFVELAKVIYRQFDGVFPQYAAKVTWTENDETGETKSVLSGYDMAIASFRPLSYSTATDFPGTSRELPTFGSIKSLVNRIFKNIYNRIDLGIEPVGGLGDVTIEVKDIELKIEKTEIKIEIPALDIINRDEHGNPIGTSQTEPATITLGYDGTKTWVEGDNDTALNPLIEQIQEAVKNLIEGTDTSLIDQINSQIRTKIIDVVNNMVNDINEQLEAVQAKINNTVKEIEDRINAQLDGRLGQAAQGLVNLYNRFATKINDIIKNPNAYLQVVMAYKTVNGELNHLSTEQDDPTLVGNGVINLYLTSYNAELIVPSYKKYVAITKVIDKDMTVNDLATLNTNVSSDFNKIIEGRQQEVAFDTSNLNPGVYEIFYQSLDYRGYTSTRKYYIEVK